MFKDIQKDYLGDSVYAESREGILILTTENEYGTSNIIYLESSVVESLKRFIARAKGEEE